MKTLEEYQEDLYERYRGLRSSPHTIARIKTALRMFVEYLEDEYRVRAPDAITLEHIHSFQSHLSTRLTKSGLPLKPRTINSVVKGVRPFALLGRECDAVFINQTGGPLSQHTLRDRVRDYGRQLGLDIHITPHTFRRSCTSEMIKSNANLYHVKQLLGHKSFETLNHYARLDIADLRKTHERCHPREKDET